MESQTNEAEAMLALDQSDGCAVPAAKRLVSFHDARLSRVLDYQSRSLEKDDPLEANLGSINSGLMRVALWLDEAVEEAMASGPPNVERLSRILPAIDTHLRVTRQVDRFAQIELRAVEARKPKPTDDSPAPLRLGSPSNRGVDESEDSEV